jgi:hypothetical protein
VGLSPENTLQLTTPVTTRLVALGDTGEGNSGQYQVAAGVQARCDRAGGCDGFLLLGDNIYDLGPNSARDPQFDEKINRPYAHLKKGAPPLPGMVDARPRLPIYVTLGNHDLGSTGLNFKKVKYFLDYARQNSWFYFPEAFYAVRVGNVQLISIHTNPLAYLGAQYREQGRLVQETLRSTLAPWRLVFGHHPYRSNAVHGNAGSYEGIPGDLTVAGGRFREWIDEFICNQADFYISAHDHNRQWLAAVPPIPTWPPRIPFEDRIPCQTFFAVSGAGAKSRPIEDRNNILEFGSSQLGFLFMEFGSSRVSVEFCNADGKTEWQKEIFKTT